MRRAAVHEAAHSVVAHLHFLPLAQVWINDAGGGRTAYQRWLTVAEAEAWSLSLFAGEEAERDRHGSVPSEASAGDLRALAAMIERLGLNWNAARLADFRMRARDLVRDHRKAIDAVAAELLLRRHLRADAITALLPHRPESSLWVT